MKGPSRGSPSNLGQICLTLSRRDERRPLRHHVTAFIEIVGPLVGTFDTTLLVRERGLDHLAPDNPAPTPPQGGPAAAPRVDLTVDRTQRQAAVPQQPTRSAAPRPAPAAEVAQRRNPSAVVQTMKAARLAPRGRAAMQ
jgi:hypothetical protein